MVKLALIDAGSAAQLWNGYEEFDAEALVRDRAGSVARLTRQLYLVLFGAEMARSAGPPASGQVPWSLPGMVGR